MNKNWNWSTNNNEVDKVYTTTLKFVIAVHRVKASYLVSLSDVVKVLFTHGAKFEAEKIEVKKKHTWYFMVWEYRIQFILCTYTVQSHPWNPFLLAHTMPSFYALTYFATSLVTFFLHSIQIKRVKIASNNSNPPCKITSKPSRHWCTILSLEICR